jgi:hypothetical protein
LIKCRCVLPEVNFPRIGIRFIRQDQQDSERFNPFIENEANGIRAVESEAATSSASLRFPSFVTSVFLQAAR